MQRIKAIEMTKMAINTPNAISEAIDEFVKLARISFPEIESIIIFGSIARGKSNKESDIDVLVIAKDQKIQRELSYLSFDLTLKYGEVFEIIVRTPQQIRELVRLGSPFIDAVVNEGVIVYGTEAVKRTCEEGIGISRGIPS